MDVGDMTAAMGGFFMGQLFAGQQTQVAVKPALMHFVSVRVDRNVDIMGIVSEVLLDVFLDLPAATKLSFEFSGGKLTVMRNKENEGMVKELVFALCGMAWTKKDQFFSLGLRNEIGAPLEMNMALLRHLIMRLDAKKVKYEIW